jgi:predicted nucleotidyltransferase
MTDKLTQEQTNFFKKLSTYIDKPLYFYGSILRNDYFNGKSDIDIVVFTDNSKSTLSKLSTFLNLEKEHFRDFISKHYSTYKINKGTKVEYQNKFVNTEISIIDENDKNTFLKLHSHQIPLYISILLIILKFLYYTLNIISKDTYKDYKHKLLHGNKEINFVKL